MALKETEEQPEVGENQESEERFEERKGRHHCCWMAKTRSPGSVAIAMAWMMPPSGNGVERLIAVG